MCPITKILFDDQTLKYAEDVGDFTVTENLQGKQNLHLGMQMLITARSLENAIINYIYVCVYILTPHEEAIHLEMIPVLWTTVCRSYNMWPDLRKAAFYAYNSKTHFSPSNNSCTCWLTIQPGIDAESCLGCFCCGLFLRLVRHPRVFESPSNCCISLWQADNWL